MTESPFGDAISKLRRTRPQQSTICCKQHGPDIETEWFFIHTGEQAWLRRREVVSTLAPHLNSKNPEAVSGALRAFYRLRGAGDESAIDPEREQVVVQFCNELDKVVYENAEHYFALDDDSVFHSLALYCGRETNDAKKTLLRIIESPNAKRGKSQALICMAWHGDANDMETLAPYMLEDSDASSSLPYHFRSSYGRDSIQHLKHAVSKAMRTDTRIQAAIQLVLFREPEGFQYLLSILKEDPEPVGKRPRHIQLVRQFAHDRLGLPKKSMSAEAIAEHLLAVQNESVVLNAE